MRNRFLVLKFFLALVYLISFTENGYCQLVAGPLGTNSLFNNGASGTAWGYSGTSFAGCSLNPYGHSQGLLVRDFGFSIPSTATITGIEAAFSYSSTGYISDTIIRLLINNIEVGTNKATNNTLSALSTTYGASNDLWGLSTISPASANSPNFGFVICVKNPNPGPHDLNAMPSTTTGITFYMTIYYSNLAGIKESQKLSSSLNLYPQPAENNLNINLNNYYEPTVDIMIADVNGKIILNKQLAVINYKTQIETSELSNGVYFLQIQNSKGYITNKRLIIAH
jgi:hypothetical protein